MSTKATESVPQGYHTVTPWIVAPDASKVIAFMEKVFDAHETEGSRMLNDDGSIGHVEVKVGDSAVMLFDSKPGWPETPSFLRLYVEDAEAAYKKALKAGATGVTETTPLFFGEKVARVRDPWGNLWWIHQRVEEVDPAEMEKRMNDPSAMKAMQYVQESLDRAMRDGAKNARSK